VIEDQTVLSIVQLEYLRALSSYLLTDPDTRKIATSSRGSEAEIPASLFGPPSRDEASLLASQF
jgi:hypothetical protein